MIDQAEFLKNFEEQFDEIEPNSLTLETDFREIEEWSSLNALLIVAMVDTEYDVTLTGDDIIKAKTIGDVYNTVQSKKG